MTRRRSVLVLPGNSARMVAKAATLTVDEVVLDLEDAVPPDPELKARARGQLVEAALAQDFGDRRLAVRINPVSGGAALEDLLQVVTALGPRLHSVVVPKVVHPGEVAFVHHVLGSLAGGAEVGIQIQIENAAGLAAVEQLAASSDRLEALIFGPGDFAASMGIPQLSIGGADPAYPGDLWHYPLFRIAVAARANSLQVLDGPYSALDDPAGLEAACRRGAALGLDGKWVIHPAQLAAVNSAFTPSSGQLEGARALLAALAEGGARRMGGQMVDEASRRLALSILSRAGEG